MAIGLEELVRRATENKALPEPPDCRAIRQNARLPRKPLADFVGVSETAIAQYESGTRRPRGEHLRRYAQALSALRAVP